MYFSNLYHPALRKSHFATLSTSFRKFFCGEDQMISVFISVVPCFDYCVPCLVILTAHEISEHLVVVPVVDVIHQGVVELQSWFIGVALCCQKLQELLAQILREKASFIDPLNSDLLDLRDQSECKGTPNPQICWEQGSQVLPVVQGCSSSLVDPQDHCLSCHLLFLNL